MQDLSWTSLFQLLAGIFSLLAALSSFLSRGLPFKKKQIAFE